VSAVAQRRRPRASDRAAAIPLPLGGDLGRLLPTARSLILGVALFLVAVAGYLGARQTSVFAIQQIEVRGAPPAVARVVAAALADARGQSLLAVDGDVVARKLGPVPWVASESFDRAFPHTLVVVVRPERPVAVLRQGARSWLVSARGRVLQTLPRRSRLELPRIWLPRKVQVEVGTTLTAADGGAAARSLAPLALVRFPAAVATVENDGGQLAFDLRSGVQLRLGDAGDLRLKLAVARRVLATLSGTARGAYVDVSVPQRPVADPNPQVAG
jgi:cell division protein FtsQ